MAEGQADTALQSQGSRVDFNNITDFVAAKTGAVNTAVLLWSGAAADQVGAPDLAEEINDADAGTLVVIRRPGIYVAELTGLVVGDAAQPTFGISKNVAAAGLIAIPALATVGMLRILPTALAAATASSLGFNLSATFEVSDQEARAVVGAVTGAQIRFHAASAGPAAPGAGLAVTPAQYKIRAVSKAFASG